ncbi:MAG TPA: mechanosensitive ion channel family protein [Thermoanaerobaculia bacterium]|nr:mechanosensitive ion channel family protein [Thermoanaerobaculia bacterium]
MQFDPTGVLRQIQQMGNAFLERLPYIVVALIVFTAFYMAAKVLRNVTRRIFLKRTRHRNVGFVLGRLAQGTLIILGLLVALVIALPTFRPGQLVQLLGIGSVAIGFAFRDILQNFLAGILLLLTEPFKIGDQIRFGEYEGIVEDVQTRATMIRTYDSRRIVIPNAELFTHSVTVNTAFPHRRLEYDVGIGYGDDVERAKELMLEAVRGVSGVLADPAPDVLLVGFGSSSVNLRARWWIEPPRRSDALDSQDGVLRAIKKTLSEHGIDLPFETQVLLFHDQTEDTDGNRKHQREGWPAGQGEVPHPRSIAEVLRESSGQGAPRGDKLGSSGSSSRLESPK